MRAIAALLICLGLAAGLGACHRGGGAPAAGDMSMGSPSAKVTMIEYASLGCPICAKWNNDNFAAFKAKYVDTGKVRYVLREMDFGDAPVAAAGFLLARCAGKDKYFQVVDEAFQQEAPYLEQPNAGPDQRAALLDVAKSAGLTEDQFDACVTNEQALAAFNKRADGHRIDDHIDATPTFVINGKSYSGYLDMATLDKAISQAEASAK